MPDWSEYRPARVAYAPLQDSESRPYTLLGVFAHVQPLHAKSEELNKSLRAAIAPMTAELVILRVAAVMGAEYEWGHHQLHAHGAGLNDDDIRAIRAGDFEHFSSGQAALLRYAGAVVTQSVTDEIWQEFSATVDTAEAVRITMLAGYYCMLSSVVAALGVPLEPQYQGLDQP